MKSLGTVGLIVNPLAGKMGHWGSNVREGFCSVLGQVDTLLVGPEYLGEEWAQGWDTPFKVVGSARVKSREDTLITTAAMVESGAEFIVVLGGDGTLRDVASSLFKMGSKVPILGVGLGSVNTGPLITLRGDADLKGLDLERVALKSCDGFGIRFNEKTDISLHDVSISNFIVGTYQGEIGSLSVSKASEDFKELVAPSSVHTASSAVKVHQPGREVVVAQGDQVGKVSVSRVPHYFFAQSCASWLGLFPLAQIPAAVCVTTGELKGPVRLGTLKRSLRESAPFTLLIHPLEYGDEVVISGIREGATLNADGTSLSLLDPRKEIRIGLLKGVCTGCSLTP